MAKKKKDLLVRLLSIKIALVIVAILIFFPVIPITVEIQCLVPPCDPITEMKSIFQIFLME